MNNSYLKDYLAGTLSKQAVDPYKAPTLDSIKAYQKETAELYPETSKLMAEGAPIDIDTAYSSTFKDNPSTRFTPEEVDRIVRNRRYIAANNPNIKTTEAFNKLINNTPRAIYNTHLGRVMRGTSAEFLDPSQGGIKPRSIFPQQIDPRRRDWLEQYDFLREMKGANPNEAMDKMPPQSRGFLKDLIDKGIITADTANGQGVAKTASLAPNVTRTYLKGYLEGYMNKEAAPQGTLRGNLGDMLQRYPEMQRQPSMLTAAPAFTPAPAPAQAPAPQGNFKGNLGDMLQRYPEMQRQPSVLEAAPAFTPAPAPAPQGNFKGNLGDMLQRYPEMQRQPSVLEAAPAFTRR